MSLRSLQIFFVFPNTDQDQGYWWTSSLSAHVLPIQAHPIVVLAIVNLFNCNLRVWSCRSTFSVSLIETSSHVIPVAFHSANMFNCSLSCIGSWLVPLTVTLWSRPSFNCDFGVPEHVNQTCGDVQSDILNSMPGTVVHLIGWGYTSLQGQTTSSIASLEIDFLRIEHSSILFWPCS